MPDLRELYQEQIRDHSKRPRNFRKLGEATCHADGRNPLCGDHVTIYLQADREKITDVSFEGAGCAICTASASMMTEALKGKSRAEADALFEKFHHLLTDGNVPADGPALGKLEVFAGVREYPVRIKCATLPWHTFHAALENQTDQAVTTE